MTREIKLRAWDRTKKEMLSIKPFCFLHLPHSGDASFSDGETDHGNYLNCDEVDLMQFTGLKDKNGKEIYEGDYVVRSLSDGSYRGPVKWDEVSLRWRVAGQEYISFGTYEVIGNIYENPELLKV